MANSQGVGRSAALVIGAASVGTVFEWYDFYLYASLGTVLTPVFFSGVPETTGFILVLLAFAAGFVVRPFGALLFGRLGDLWGRKNTFLVTMLLMGLSTVVVGLLPSYKQIGVAAPLALVAMRLIQGLALGGEYGGAATYVAEHAPAGKRGLYTSWIQTTATLGLFLSLLVIVATRFGLDPNGFAHLQAGDFTVSADAKKAFETWGWRIPFLVSAVLLLISMWIRLRLKESPLFQQMVEEGTASKKPLVESFLRWSNLKVVILALFGAAVGQAVVWYTGQFYALFFLEKILKVDGALTNVLVAIALVIGTPFFIFFGWLSDKIGRKPIILLGCLLAAATYFPLFNALTDAANPGLAKAEATAPVIVSADPADCSIQFDPIGKAVFDSSCDIAKSYLAKAGVPYRSVDAAAGFVALVKVGPEAIPSFRGHGMPKAELKAKREAFEKSLGALVKAQGYPAKADPAKMDKVTVVGILTLLVLYVTMVYGPIAAFLVELFPTRIRYTSMSLPYHIANGWFGGFLPFTAFALVAATGDIYFGLWYPVVAAAATVIIGFFFVKDTRKVDISA
ncbi:MAG: MFS transporter [Proteobacteria bacterium]|nr:MFS transporter [Pseudomonadota bacterium]